MIVLGLTGSVGMGKSVIAAMLETMRIPVHDADRAVHCLLEREARPAVAAAFPFYQYPEIYNRKDKSIHRGALGALIFKDHEKRMILESILHPLVRKWQNDFIRAARFKGLDMVALEIPLLFETGAEERVDVTITASAPYFIQRERVLARPTMSEEKFYAILSRQMPDAEKCLRSDFVIKTGLGRAHTLRQIRDVVLNLRGVKNSKKYDLSYKLLAET
jgi:dephospho-CoA kinase